MGGHFVGREHQLPYDAFGDGPHPGVRNVGDHAMSVLRHCCPSPVAYRSPTAVTTFPLVP